MSVFVGLDCGGSSSRVLAIDENGKVLHSGSSGAANLVSTPDQRLRRNLARAIEGCPQPDSVCGCFAGLVNQDLRNFAISVLRDFFPNAQLTAEPDYAAAFFASDPGTQVCVIAGTGSLVCSFDGKHMYKSGGRGYLLGDEGSGYQFGRDALIHYLNDPSLASPALRAVILDVLKTDQESEIIPLIYKSAPPSTLIAKLAKGLAKDANESKAYALSSIEQHTGALARVTARHIRAHVPGTTVKVSLAGGIWKASTNFMALFRDVLQDELSETEVDVRRISRPPLQGAVALAQQRFNRN